MFRPWNIESQNMDRQVPEQETMSIRNDDSDEELVLSVATRQYLSEDG